MATRLRSDKKQETSFYAIPDNIRTSSQIIDDAKRSLRAVPIKRPHTPAPDGRHLFGVSTNKISLTERPSRPPSVFSIGPGKFNEEISRPSSRQRLSPIVNEEFDVPVTHSQSLVNVSHSTTSLPGDEPVVPVLKTSQSSPTTSRRIRSAGRGSGERQTDHKELITGSSISNDSMRSSRSQIGQIWDSKVKPLLDQLNPLSNDTAHLCQVCTDIWNVLERNDLFGKAVGSKRRSVLLKSVFGLLSHKDPLLLLKLARLILAMQVTGSNFINVCKLVFSLIREENNDNVFLKEDIAGSLINALSNADPQTQHEAMVYGMGTIKLLASNPQLREELSQKDCVRMMSLCLQKCSELTEVSENKRYIANVLVQLIAALRNLSDTGSVYEQFIAHSIPHSLANVLQKYYTNSELVFNLSRLLSKLTLAQQCLHAVTQVPLYLSLLPNALNTHVKNEEIVLRLCFILSNLTNDSADISHILCHSHSLITALHQVLSVYYQIASPSSTDISKSIDVLIKSISLVANLSVHKTIASIINSNEEMISLLLIILESFTHVDELTVNTLAALNNLSFYSQEAVLINQNKVIKNLLSPDNQIIMLECIRVLGNLTRLPSARVALCSRRVDELLITLLDSKHIELVYAVCGVLVNLMIDRESLHVILRKNNGVRKLLDVLSHFGRQDWLLASLTCKVLWNYSEGLANVKHSFTDEEVIMMSHLLEEYLDPVTAFINYMIDEEEDDNGLSNSTQQFWTTDFVPVATDIIQRLSIPIT